MANVKISGLPSATTPLTGAELVPVVQGGVTSQTTVGDFNYFIQDGTGAVGTTVQTKLRETVSVKDFGAVGDNVTDDTIAIQSALNAATGKKLVFPNGSNTYLISAELLVGSNTQIDLGGNIVKQKAASEIENGLFYISSGKTNVLIENGTIDVNVANQSYVLPKTDSGRGILIYTASNITVQGIKFINPYGSMILAAASSNVIIEECDINDSNGTGTNAIMFNQCTNCDVVHCTGTGKLGVTGYGIYATGTCSRLRALSNNFTYWQIVFSGVDYITAGGGSGMAYCAIELNTLIEPSADTSIHFGVHGSVSNNIIVNSHDVGISIDFSTHTVCNGNVIRTTNAGGIVAAGCVDCVINGNMISNPGAQWISAVTPGLRCGVWTPNTPTGTAPYQTPSGNVISNNTIRDDLGTHQMYYGISLYDASGTNINFIHGNYISGAVSANYDIPIQTNIGEFESIKAFTYLNSWVNYGSPFVDGGYCKSEDGIVTIRGLIKSGTVGAVAFNIPAGYRPLNQLMFNVITNTGSGRLDVYQNGDVIVVSGGNGYVSLSGITFPTR